MTFKQFLIEGQQFDFSSYEKAAGYLSGQRKEKYLAALAAFQKALDDKEIFNAEFKELYSYGLSRGLEAAWEELYRPLYRAGKVGHFDSLFAVNSIKKLQREAQKQNAREIITFLSWIETIPDMIKEVKKYIRMGRKPNPNSAVAQRFQPTINRNDALRVADMLRKLVESVRQEYENSFAESYIQQVQREWQLFQKADRSFLWRHFLLRLVVDGMNVPFKLKANWQDILRQEAKKTVGEILDGFIAKNTKKLAAIVSAKGSLKDMKVLRQSISGYNFENTIRFTFEDGASFIVYSQTVYKHSARGLPFTQYPTRFTDVRLSDGTKMRMPSEEKMNKEFR